MLGSQQRAVVLAQGELLHPAVFQDVVVDDAPGGLRAHAALPAGGVGRQDVVDVVDAAEGQVDVHRAVDGQCAVLQIHRRGGVIRGGLGVAAGGAAVGADVVVVDVVVGHGGVAEGAVGPVVIDPRGGVRGEGRPVHAEPDGLFVSLGEAGGEGIIGVQDQLRLRMDGGQNRLIDALRMAVAGELVPVEVGDDELRGMEGAEGVAGVALVTL